MPSPRQCALVAALCLLLTTLNSLSAAAESMDEELRRAVSAFEMQNWSEARAILDNYLLRAPEDVLAMAYAARLSLVEGDYQQARAQIEKALLLAPDNGELHFRAGEIYGRLAQEASKVSALRLARQSLGAFERALALSPDNPRFHFGLMRYHLNAPKIVGGDPERARHHAGRIAALEPLQGVLAELELHQALEQPTEFEGALARGLQHFPDDAGLQMRAGEYYAREGRVKKALRHMLRAAALTAHTIDSPEATRGQQQQHFKALYLSGQIAAQNALMLEEGRDALRRFIERYPDRDNIAVLDWALWHLATIYEALDDGHEAHHIYILLLNVSQEPKIRQQLFEKDYHLESD